MSLIGRWFSRKPANVDADVAKRPIADALKKTKEPIGPVQSAQLGADIRQRLFNLIDKVEAETGTWAVAFVKEDQGRLMVHPKLTEEIRKQASNLGIMGGGGLLESAIGLCFPTPHSRRVCNEEWPAYVAKYRNRPNSEDLLREKAAVLTAFVASNLDAARTCHALVTEREIDLTDEQDMLLRLEEAACWDRVIDELAHRYIGADRPLFIDYLREQLAKNLALEGASPDAIYGTMAERHIEYAQQPLRPKDGQGARGTVLWEAAKHVAPILVASDNPAFLAGFGICFLERLNRSLLYELLTGRHPENK